MNRVIPIAPEAQQVYSVIVQMTDSNLPHRVCEIQGCGRRARHSRWCNMHYQRFRRLGDPNAPVRPVTIPRNHFCVGDTCFMQLSDRSYTLIDRDKFTKLSSVYWQRSTNGYIQRNDRRTNILLHREVLGLTCPSFHSDHINRIRDDNRAINLRPCTRSQNMRNAAPQANKKYKGVGFHKRNKRWRAYISVDGSQISLGQYDTAEEAALAYNHMAKTLFGDFAHLNIIDESGKRSAPVTRPVNTESVELPPPKCSAS